MWVPRRDLKRGLVMWALPLERRRVLGGKSLGVIINPAKPSPALTNLEKAVPERKDVNPDNFWVRARRAPGEEIPGLWGRGGSCPSDSRTRAGG